MVRVPFKIASLPLRLHRHVRFQLDALPHILLPFAWEKELAMRETPEITLTFHTINLPAHVLADISNLSLDYATPLDIGIDTDI